jgi:hypothetical protein
MTPAAFRAELAALDPAARADLLALLSLLRPFLEAARDDLVRRAVVATGSTAEGIHLVAGGYRAGGFAVAEQLVRLAETRPPSP